MAGGGRPPILPSWKDHTRNFQDWFGRFGSATRNIRAIFDGIVPVSVLDRFRDDSEGSLFAINASTPGSGVEFSAVAMGSADNDIEVHAIRAFAGFGATQALALNMTVHVFSPIAPYNPVVNPNPVGVFVPGLITNKAFTFGTAGAVAGTNPALANPLGFEWELPRFGQVIGSVTPFPFGGPGPIYFDPPIRVYRDGTLAVQMIQPITTWSLFVSFLYRERPRTTP